MKRVTGPAIGVVIALGVIAAASAGAGDPASPADRAGSAPTALDAQAGTAFLGVPYFWMYLPDPAVQEPPADGRVGADPGSDEHGTPPGSAGEFELEDVSPRVDYYGDSGCRVDGEGNNFWPCGEDEFYFLVDGSTLYALHANAVYNCCPDDIVITLTLEEDLIRLDEAEILEQGGCYCICCFDVDVTVVNLESGTYGVEFYWYDYDTDQVECHVDEIVIP